MPSEAKVKTSIYLPSDLHWKLKEAAVKARLTDTAAMQLAIEDWTSGRIRGAKESTEDSKTVAVLLDALHHGDKGIRDIVQRAIRDWEPKYKARMEEQRNEKPSGQGVGDKRTA